MSSGNGAVDVILWLAAFTLLIAFGAVNSRIAFGSDVYTKDLVAFLVTGGGLLVCLAFQQYLKKANGRTRSDDG